MGSQVLLRSSALSYLHGDHLLSTATTSNGSGTVTGNIQYTAYGRYRRGSEVATENRFTSQKLDNSSLYYYNARSYDPQLGQFLSPDTLVPDPTNLFDYNRYMDVRGNPLRYNDPTGHQTDGCPLHDATGLLPDVGGSPSH